MAKDIKVNIPIEIDLNRLPKNAMPIISATDFNFTIYAEYKHTLKPSGILIAYIGLDAVAICKNKTEYIGHFKSIDGLATYIKKIKREINEYADPDFAIKFFSEVKKLWLEVKAEVKG